MFTGSSDDCNSVAVTHADRELLLDSLLASKKNHGAMSPTALLRRQTHLHLQGRSLVGTLAGCLYELVPLATVAFFQENELTHVPAISSLRNLTMLYLQVCSSWHW